MRACPRRFSFRYVERAPADFVAGRLLFGGAIHAALELHFRAMLEGLSASAIDVLGNNIRPLIRSQPRDVLRDGVTGSILQFPDHEHLKAAGRERSA